MQGESKFCEFQNNQLKNDIQFRPNVIALIKFL